MDSIFAVKQLQALLELAGDIGRCMSGFTDVFLSLPKGCQRVLL